MAKQPTSTSSSKSPENDETHKAPTKRPRLHRLLVSNFRCIGANPVEIELDEIVVLVGPNNSGKSSILRAYQVAMSHGSKDGELGIDDFPNATIDPNNPPTIELETVVYDKQAPGEKWVRTDPNTGEMYVRERWTWKNTGKPSKVGWDASSNEWHDKSGPWGAPNVANINRPQPHYVSAFQDPAEQEKEIVKLLTKALTDRVKELSKAKTDGDGSSEESEYEKLLNAVQVLQHNIASDAITAVEDVRTELSGVISQVFPGYDVTFDARPDEELDKSLSLFKAGPKLKIGPSNGYQTTLEYQGSGARRTLLWAALRILAERKGKSNDNERPFLLLMDEPEICLHPDAIREACNILYDLPSKNQWQVMITTHSPIFIDFSRDNTSIVRVGRDEDGNIEGTTIYRPANAKLDEDDKKELKLLNICDPYIAEFFFGGHTIIVEGDTEYTAFKYVIESNPADYKNIHIVRARGKYPIVSLCKILNQFGKNYAVLHDADTPKRADGKKNSAWTANQRILDEVAMGVGKGQIRLVASLPDFEQGFFGLNVKNEKPYTALKTIREDPNLFKAIKQLLDSLIDFGKDIPEGAIEWCAVNDLEHALAMPFDKKQSSTF